MATISVIATRLLFLGLFLWLPVQAHALNLGQRFNTRPLPPDIVINEDGSAGLRVCFNSSCASQQWLDLDAWELDQVRAQMDACPLDDNLDHRLQRVRLAIWQMERLSLRYLPQLANDEAVNNQEFGIEGRTDCVDNASNTATFLKLLIQRGELPGWRLESASVRRPLDINNVHWTAVLTDVASGTRWAVDSWFRPHGHLPFIMPLSDWKDELPAWEPPFAQINRYPVKSVELCQ